jgi:hypothetical protein
MPSLSHLHQLFDVHSCYASILRYGGKTGCSNVPAARVTTSVPGTMTTTAPGANATAVVTASGPSMTSAARSLTRAGVLWRTGCWPPFCCACRVRRGALPVSWGCMCVRAIAGAGGCAMSPCPMRWSANSRAQSNLTQFQPHDGSSVTHSSVSVRWEARSYPHAYIKA